MLRSRGAPWAVAVVLVVGHVALLVADRAHRDGSVRFGDWRWNAVLDAGWFEVFRGAQLIAAGVLLVLWVRGHTRSRGGVVLSAWAAALMVLVLDDTVGLHEAVGGQLVRELGLATVGDLRAQDQGELLALAGAGVALVVAIGIAHLRSDAAAQAVSITVAGGVAVMATFGVAVDLVHAVAVHDTTSFADYVLAVAETSGETLGASLVLLAALAAVRAQAAAAGTAEPGVSAPVATPVSGAQNSAHALDARARGRLLFLAGPGHRTAATVPDQAGAGGAGPPTRRGR